MSRQLAEILVVSLSRVFTRAWSSVHADGRSLDRGGGAGPSVRAQMVESHADLETHVGRTQQCDVVKKSRIQVVMDIRMLQFTSEVSRKRYIRSGHRVHQEGRRDSRHDGQDDNTSLSDEGRSGRGSQGSQVQRRWGRYRPKLTREQVARTDGALIKGREGCRTVSSPHFIKELFVVGFGCRLLKFRCCVRVRLAPTWHGQLAKGL